MHTYIPDENTGYMSNAAAREPDERFFMPKEKVNIWYWKRPNIDQFLAYINEKFEPILFTQCDSVYANFMMDKVIDPERTIFRHRLFQNSCYILEKNDEDLLEYVKDIHQFGREPSKSLLLDCQAINYILQPDNVVPCESYLA